MFNRSSKEEEVQKISISIFITNLPDSFNAKDLWRVSNQYGTVVDAFIPDKRSKANKRYGFVRFIKADNVERLVSNLCTIWVGNYRLHANIARFQRKPMNQYFSQTSKIQTNKQGKKDVSTMKAANGFAGSFAHAVKKGTKSHYEEVESQPALVLDESCLNQSDMSTALMGKVKTFNSLSNLKPVLAKEGFDEIKLKYMGGLWVMIDFQTITSKEKFMANTSVATWFSHLQQATHNVFIEERAIWVNIDGVPLKVWSKNTFKRIASKWGELIYDDDQEEMYFHNKRICVLTKFTEPISETFKIIVQGRVFWVRAKEECGWTPDFVEEEENESEYDEMASNEGDHTQNPNLVINDSDIEEVQETIFENSKSQNLNEAGRNVEQKHTQSEDPFNIYDILNKKKEKPNGGSSSDSNLKYPPGFTPSFVDEDKREDSNISGDENEIRSKYVQVEVSSPCEKEIDQNRNNGGHNDVPKPVSGLVLRMGQCLFAAASIAVMSSASGFATSTAFCYLIAAMGLQVLWSFGLACLDIHALRLNKDLHNHIFLSLLVVGDWVTAILSLAAASSSAGVMVVFIKDTNICRVQPTLSCNTFQISIALAFVAWFLLAVSSYVMFWLLATI
ncbi:hypothetical protein CTI12_AA123530 [Artemisia annua]|uniref:RRM domain-containing protein n=1 Tax=Artemisia annua TaxID=35608 RepID=A0A2U1PR43_ARTAN|nr:hypothetical protein CTI12_AA123530 [Artemisia annua]